MSYKKHTWQDDDYFTPEQATEMSETLADLDAAVVSEIGEEGQEHPTLPIAKNGFFIKKEIENGNTVYNIYQVKDGQLIKIDLNAKTFDGKTLADFDVDELIQLVNELNLKVNDIVSGTEIVGVARSLFSPTRARDDEVMLYRTTGGDMSLGNGDATLYRVGGNCSLPKITLATATPVVGGQAIPTVTIDAELFFTSYSTGATFNYSSNAWTYNGEEVDLSTAGVVITGTPLEGDILSISVEGSEGSRTASYTYTRSSQSFNVDINVDVFKFEVSESGTYTFMFDGTSWTMDGSRIELSVYGIVVRGTYTTGSSFDVIYTKEIIEGQVAGTLPRKFGSTGLNQFDRSTMFIKDAVIDANNTVIPSVGDYVIYARVPINVYKNRDCDFTVYSESKSILRVGILDKVPEMGDVIRIGDDLVDYNSELSYVRFTNEMESFPENTYYVVVAVSNKEDICIHPTWSGYMDKVFQEYTLSEIVIPYGSIESYGLIDVKGTKDYIDSELGMYVKQTARVPYNKQNLYNVKEANKKYIWDANWIYYDLSALQIIQIPVSFKGDYQANDFGCEYFTGTSIPAWVKIDYQANLVDKLRTDVLTISEQTLNENQKRQVWSNLGLYDLSEEEF